MRRRRKQGIAALLLALCVTLGLLPALTPAASAADNVPYLDWDDAEKKLVSTTYTGDYTLVTSGSTAWGAGWYVVDGTVEIATRVEVTDDIHLILKDGANLNAKAGITVTDNNSLTIYAQSEGESMGKLSATGGQYSAGIGGGYAGNGGTITVNGGEVTANGGQYGAGIGGGVADSGNGGNGGTITVNGGAVTARGGNNGAGIGGGLADGGGGNGGTVTVNGDRRLRCRGNRRRRPGRRRGNSHSRRGRDRHGGR